MKIPDGWIKVKFGDVVNKINDKVPNREEWTFDRYIGKGHIDSGEIRITKSSPIEGNEEVIGPAFHMRFKQGHVLYMTRGIELRKAGIVDFEGVCSQVCFVLQADETKLLQSLLPFIMQTEEFAAHAVNNMHGSVNTFLNWKDIAKYEFLLPPLKEQKKISELLWGVENNIKSEEIYAALSFRTYHKIIFDLFSVKKKQIKLIDLCEKITKGTTPTTYGMGFTSDGINFLKIESIDEMGRFIPSMFAHIDEKTNDILKRSIIKEGDILFSIAGAIGRVAIVDKSILPANTNQAIAIVRLKKNVNKEYIKEYLSSKFVKQIIEKLTVKTAQANISLELLSKLPVPITDENEQKEIIVTINNIHRGISEIKTNINLLKNMRAKLSNELLSGNMRLE